MKISRKSENRDESTMKLNEIINEKYLESENTLTNYEFGRMVKVAKTLRDKLILRLLLATGMKISELHNLNVNNVDTKNFSISIESKKNRRQIDIDKGTSILIRQYIDNARGTPGNGEKALLLNHARKRLSIRTIQQIIKSCCENAEIKKSITALTFRKTVWLILKKRGCPKDKIMAFLGYTSRYGMPQWNTESSELTLEGES